MNGHSRQNPAYRPTPNFYLCVPSRMLSNFSAVLSAFKTPFILVYSVSVEMTVK
jgi:hypothetical protein